MPAEWRVLIADDEPAARRGVRQLLAAFPEFDVSGECRDGSEVLAALEHSVPDAIFLDIAMPGLDGFEVIRRTSPARLPEVLFLTAYDQFAVRAFEVEALDYLLKPVSEARFARAIERLTLRLRTSERQPASIVVPINGGIVVLRTHEIDWIEAADNYVRIWAAGRNYLLRESLDTLAQRLEPHGFARAHRSALVRLGAVRSLIETVRGELVALLGCDAQVPISRRRRALFRAALAR